MQVKSLQFLEPVFEGDSYMKYAGYYFVVIYHIMCNQNKNINLDSI